MGCTTPPRIPLEDIEPHIKRAFEYYARKALAAGRKRFSATMIINRMRWYTQIESNDPEYKINDHCARTLADWLMATYPEFADFFETRDKQPK